ncbi:MAG: hypothetical protein ACYC27_15770 [Armatimonadota bacterium]
MKRGHIMMVALLVLSISAAHADKALYVNLISDSPVTLTDLWQKDLVSGETSLLISHTSVPKDFNTRIDSVNPSPDGAYLLIESSIAYDIIYKDGRKERQYGNGPHGGENNAKYTLLDPKYRFWVWGFKDRKMRPVISIGPNDLAIVTWDTAQSRLLIASPAKYSDPPKQRLLKKGSLRSCDPATGVTRTLFEFQNPGDLMWSVNGELQLAKTDGPAVIQLLQFDMKGKARVLPTKPGKSDKVSSCKPGDLLPYYIDGAVYLTSSNGTTRFIVEKNLGHTWEDPWTFVEFAFDKDKDRLVVLYIRVSGPGHLVRNEHLWIVDTKTCKARVAVQWKQKGIADLERELLAWTPQGDGVIIRERQIHENSYSLKKCVLTDHGVNIKTLLPDDKRCIWTVYMPN